MVPPCFAPTLMSLRTSAHTGVAISIESRGASKRFNGRTRGCLPIGTPAPRPCSADPDPPHHTNRGSLKGFACVLFSSQLLQIYDLIIQSKNPIVNRKIIVYPSVWTVGADIIRPPILQRKMGFSPPSFMRGARHFIIPAPRTMPPPRRRHRPPASPRSWARSSPARIPPQIPDDPQTRKPPTRRRRC